MNSKINSRLKKLKSRRNGSDSLFRLSDDAQIQIMRESSNIERWENRASNKPNTQYALGAMQEVEARYTQISIETAQRVKNQLNTRLNAIGVDHEFRLQGSVPLNIHIKGVSDVDLLTIDTSFFTYMKLGAMSLRGYYQNPTTKTSSKVLTTLRENCIDILNTCFPAVKIDASGGKAIALSGGSLARPVDVVPAHWHDTFEYQVTQQEHNRGITILDVNKNETIDNLPFLHIHRIDERNQLSKDGLKKAIRLLKNIKNDAIEEGKKINLPSFDIASLMYHADITKLQSNVFYELSVLSETYDFLNKILHDKEYALSLDVPDGTRKIFNSNEKYESVSVLRNEVKDLLEAISEEQFQVVGINHYNDYSAAIGRLSTVHIP